ncbi:MAG TPA: LLM class flavin-dependent oxidoreductase [Dehalococcoidia bacterium]|nr:LLM class flavin-dependent oxidoreductase [Dehalococcoidia bacterium]
MQPSALKVGVSLTTALPRSIPAREAGRMLVERARAVREAGLDSLFVGDHHNTPGHYFQGIPTIGRLMAETGDMVTGALFLLPLYQPYLLAEQVGTLAALAQGPFVVIVAAGEGEEQFSPFAVPLKTRPSRMEEHLTILRRLLDGERLTFEGRYHTLTDAAISPLPPQPVPIWVGASARPALERAGRMGDAWLAAPSVFGERLQVEADIYRQAAAAAGREPHLAIRRDIYVGETDADAEAATRPVLERGYRGFSPETLVIGGAQRVAEEFAGLAEMGFEHVLVRHIVLDQALVLASYRRLGQMVLPLLRRQ